MKISLGKMKANLWVMLAATALFFSGCDNAQHTVDSLHKEIVEYRATPDTQKQEQIDQNFVKLQKQVADLEKKDDDKASEYKSDLYDLQSDYQAAKMAKAVQDAKNAIQGFGDALKDSAKSIESAFKGSSTNK